MERNGVSCGVRDGFFCVRAWDRFFFRWLIVVDFFFVAIDGYDLKSEGLLEDSVPGFFGLWQISVRWEEVGGTKIGTKKTW